MHCLYLLRHGTAVSHGTADVRDEDRPLTPAGERKVSLVAHGLKRLGIKPRRIVTSPLPRAHRTAQITADALGLTDRLELAEVLQPGSPPSRIRDWLSAQDAEDLMLVGHNPNLTGLLSLLAGLPLDSPAFELKKGAVASLRADDQGRHQLHWLATSKVIRSLMKGDRSD